MPDTGCLMPVEPVSSIEDPGSLHTNGNNDANVDNDINETICLLWFKV